MSRLTSAADYRRELAAVDGLISEQERLAAEYGMDFSTELTIQSLQERRAELAQELANLTDEDLPGHELSLIVRGAPVHEHAVEAKFLGQLLQDMQKLIRALVAAQYGDQRRQGPWHPEVLRRSTLQFTESFAGSFGMTLEAVDEQMELEGHLAVQPAFNDLFGVLTSGLERGAFLESLAPLGPRARSHLRAMLEHLGDAEADLELRWPLVRGEKVARLTRRTAQTLADTLRRIDESEHLETVFGVLEGAILRTGYFEIQKEDGSVIGGRVSQQLQRQIAPHFNRRVKASLIVTTVTDRGTDETRVSYRLVELEADLGQTRKE